MSNRVLYYGDPINRSHPLNRGLVSEWAVVPWYSSGPRFIDLAGRNHGTLTNGPRWSEATGRPGGFGSLSFDGSDDYITIADSSTLKPTTEFSIFYWMSPRTSSDIYPVTIRKSNDSAVPNYGFSVAHDSNSTGALIFEVITNSGTQSLTGSGTFSTAGNWYYIGVTFISGGAQTTYINGVQDATRTSAGTSITWNTDPITLADIGAIGGASWSGFMDDVAFFSRALSASEVYALCDGSRRGNPSRWNWLSTRTYFGVTAGGGPSPPRSTQVLRGGGIAEIAFPAWQQSFRFQ